MENKRLIYIDYLRVLSLISIIGIHVSDIVMQNNAYNFQWWYGTLVQSIVRRGLDIFFMISGALILNGKDESIPTFYYKRFSKIVIPLFLYSFIYLYLYTYGMRLFDLKIIATSLKAILRGPVIGHLWFVYTVLGLYLASPFLKIMLKSLSDRMLLNLAITIVVFKAICINAPLLGFNIGISFIFDGWLIYFILGYILTRLTFKKYKTVYILGISSFIINIVISRFLSKDFQGNLNEFSPTTILICSSIYLFFEQNKSFFESKKFCFNVVSFISKYSYSTYLIHVYSLHIVNTKLKLSGLSYNFIIGVPVTILLTFAISVILAFSIDNILVNPLTRLFRFIVEFIKNIVYKSKTKNRILDII